MAVQALFKLQTIAAITIMLIFALIAGIIGAVLWYSQITGIGGIGLAVGLSLGIVLLQWAIGPALIRMFTRAKEVKKEQAPALYQMVEGLASKAGIPMPKLYVVQDKSPNAFAFGRSQHSAGIAVHTGLLDALPQPEVEAVLAHEIGHIKHRDVMAITIASVLPLMLYYIVLVTGTRDERQGGGFLLVWLGAMAAQFVGNLIVLWLSRSREYYADAFSAYVTGQPVNLMKGLARITYRQAVSPAPARSVETGMRAFYIADPVERQSIVEVAAALDSGDPTKLENALEAEKRKAPLQVLLTHPLTVNRLAALNRIRKELA